MCIKVLIRYSCSHTGRTLGSWKCERAQESEHIIQEAAGNNAIPDSHALKLRKLLCESESDLDYQERDRPCHSCSLDKGKGKEVDEVDDTEGKVDDTKEKEVVDKGKGKDKEEVEDIEEKEKEEVEDAEEEEKVDKGKGKENKEVEDTEDGGEVRD